MISMLTNIISAFVSSKVGQSKIPGFNQTVGELATSKTNVTSMVLIGYAINLLSNDPDIADRIIGNVMILYSTYATFQRDTQFRNPE